MKKKPVDKIHENTQGAIKEFLETGKAKGRSGNISYTLIPSQSIDKNSFSKSLWPIYEKFMGKEALDELVKKITIKSRLKAGKHRINMKSV